MILSIKNNEKILLFIYLFIHSCIYVLNNWFIIPLFTYWWELVSAYLFISIDFTSNCQLGEINKRYELFCNTYLKNSFFGCTRIATYDLLIFSTILALFVKKIFENCYFQHKVPKIKKSCGIFFHLVFSVYP